MWAPAWDAQIRVSLSNCGCISYRASFAADAGSQAEFVVPDLASGYDMEDVIAVADQCSYLVIGAEENVWSRGARDTQTRLAAAGGNDARFDHLPGGNEFAQSQRRTPTRS